MNNEHLTQLRNLFRTFYGYLPVEELANNKELGHSIKRVEDLFRKVMTYE